MCQASHIRLDETWFRKKLLSSVVLQRILSYTIVHVSGRRDNLDIVWLPGKLERVPDLRRSDRP